MNVSRVTDSLRIAFLRDQLNGIRRKLLKAQEEVGSGKRVNRPSDDPSGAAEILRLRTAIADRRQEATSVGSAAMVLEASDGALGGGIDIMHRALEIATQHAGSLTGQAERDAAAAEVHELLSSLVALANSEFGGRRLFGSLVEGSPPFVSPDDPSFDPASPYTGPAYEFQIVIGGGERVTLAGPGDAVFGSSIAALAALESALTSGGDVGATIDQLRSADDDVETARATVGSRLERVVNRRAQIDREVFELRERLSLVEDADIADAVIRLTQLQNALQTTAAAGAVLLETSLAGVLRP